MITLTAGILTQQGTGDLGTGDYRNHEPQNQNQNPNQNPNQNQNANPER